MSYSSDTDGDLRLQVGWYRGYSIRRTGGGRYVTHDDRLLGLAVNIPTKMLGGD